MGADQLGEETRRSGSALKVRAFFGLPLPDPHRDALDLYRDECVRVAPDFRWTPAANLHVTIRFLGHVEEDVAFGIASRVGASGPDGFACGLGETGTFRRGRLARVVWIGLSEGEQDAGRLAALVEAECVRAGLEPETRPFRAHITVARAKPRDGAPLPELPRPPAVEPWRASRLLLYQSRLGRSGSIYEPLRTIPLR